MTQENSCLTRRHFMLAIGSAAILHCSGWSAGMRAAITKPKWTHIAATINFDKLEMFIDGKKIASVSRGRYLKFFGERSLTIGKEQDKQTLGMIPNSSFTGLISEMVFYRQYRSDPARM